MFASNIYKKFGYILLVSINIDSNNVFNLFLRHLSINYGISTYAGRWVPGF
jgi:hypothetical protein